MIHATLHGQIDMVELLLGKNANVNAMDNQGNTALIYAARSSYDESIEKSRYNEIVEMLIQNNADVDAKNLIGDTPLIHATRRNNIEGIEILL